MYPTGELDRLARHKAALCCRIAYRRLECAEAVAGVERPLRWLDRVVAFWRRVSPVAKVAALPLALLAQRMLFPRFKLLRSFSRWGPAFVGAFRMASALRAKTQQ